MSQKPTTPQVHRRSYANVTLVERVLAVLQSINRLPHITVQAISRECDIPAPSVIRILETLCAEGFLVRVSRRGGYVLTSKVKLLSAGFHGSPLVVEVLKAHCDELTRKHLWPLSVATLEHDAMVVQYSSIPLSPHAHARSTLHKRLSLISRAHGLAYLAFCSSLERHRLARIAVRARRPEDAFVSSAQEWRGLVHQARKRGYAVRIPEIDPVTCTIAVPIQLEPNCVAATLGMTFFRSVVREPQMASYASALKSVATVAAERLRLDLMLRAQSEGDASDMMFDRHGTR